MKNIIDFRNSRKEVSPEHLGELYGYDPDNSNCQLVYVYHNQVSIERCVIGNLVGHCLIIDQTEYCGTLEDLEESLWDWYKWQIHVDPSDIEDDIHERIRVYMNSQGWPSIALEELYHEAVRNKIENFMRLWDEAATANMTTKYRWYIACQLFGNWDSGEVIARNEDEARSLAFFKINENLEAINHALKHSDNTKEFSIESTLEKSDIQITVLS